MTDEEKRQLVDAVISQLKSEGTDIANAAVIENTSGVTFVIGYKADGSIVRVNAENIANDKNITWNNGTNPSDMNDFVVAGVYTIQGERTRSNDNLPILNTGGGHTFNARLTVLDSSIPGTGKNDDKCITQVLSFSNRLGQGEVYIRTGKGNSLSNLTWEAWSTLQRNVNVVADTYDNFTDNGIYSGVANTTNEMFVLVVINNYALATPKGAQRSISQFKYSVNTGGSVALNKRVKVGDNDWGDWEILNNAEINAIKTELVEQINGETTRAELAEQELLKRIQGTSDQSNAAKDPFKFLGTFLNINDSDFKTALNSLHSTSSGEFEGFWRAKVASDIVEIQNIVINYKDDRWLQVLKSMYGYNASTGNFSILDGVRYRIMYREHNNASWGDWVDVDQHIYNSLKTNADNISNEITRARTEENAIRKLISDLVGESPATLDTIHEISSWILNDKTGAAAMATQINANTNAVNEERERAEAMERQLQEWMDADKQESIEADKNIRENAMQYNTLGVNVYADKAEIYGRSIDSTPRTVEFPVATSEKAGVMSAEDKTTLDSMPVEIEKVKDGNTIVGQAREIHSRNGKAVTDSFLVRTTAGSGTVGDGVASLKSVGGNIVKNYLGSVSNSNTSRFSREEKDGMFFATITGTQAAANCTEVYYCFDYVVGHKYYVKALIKSPKAISIFLGGYGKNTVIQNKLYKTYTQVSNIVEVTEDHNKVMIYPWGYAETLEEGTSAAYRFDAIIDLTEMFGAGNEPDQATCDRLFGTMDALPQGLSIANPIEFKSTGYNQADPNKVLANKGIENGVIVDKVGSNVAVIPCLPCKIGVGENNGYCVHGAFDEGTEKVYLTPLNPFVVEGELYLEELSKDATTDTYVPQIKGYMLVEVPTTANLCAHFLWSEDKCERDAYEPYFESKIELPTIPQMSEYGLAGIQSSGTLVCDEIDFEKSVYRKKIKDVELSQLSWWGYKTGTCIYFCDMGKNTNGITNALLCERYSIVKYGGTLIDSIPNKCMMFGGGKYLYIRDDDYATNTGFKNSLTGLYAYYAIATPEEYPLPKVDNSYISSDYGVEQFDSVVPCNANNLYYMRSLAGETRNFLDRMYNNTAKTDAKEVADYITNNLADKIPLATAENNGLMSATAFSSIGEVIDITEEDEISFYVGSSTNKTVFNYYTKSDNCTITATLKNVVGNYSSVRFYMPSTYYLPYVLMDKCSNGNYFGSKSLIGLPKGSLIQIKVFTSSTAVGSVNENSVIEIREQSYKGNVRPRVDIFTSDTQLEVFEKMLYANNIGHCDVHFQMGTYTFDETLYDWMRSERKYSRAELPIGGNCRYFFNGATLIGSYAGVDTHVAGNCNVLGCAMTSGNFELYDGTIIANDIVYGVHDDGGASAMGDSHFHKYNNMHIIYNGGTRAKNKEICKCIGGGTCKNLTVIVDNCVLEKYTENTNKDCVTYHGFSNNPSYQTKARILITNTWMTGACRAYHLVQESRNETIEFVVSNCRTNVTSSDVDKLITWNNEPIS